MSQTCQSRFAADRPHLRSPRTGPNSIRCIEFERGAWSALLSLGPVTLDDEYVPVEPAPVWPAKLGCIPRRCRGGGAPFNVAVAAERTGIAPTMLPIVGNDPKAECIAALARQEFRRPSQLIRTAEMTRSTAIVPNPYRPGTSTCLTQRSAIAVAETLQQTEPFFATHRLWFIGSFTDGHHELVSQILARKRRQPGVQLYLMLTASQCEHWSRTISLLTSGVDYAQMNLAELQALTGQPDLHRAVYRLRDAGVKTTLIITLGRRGIAVHESGAVGWSWAAASDFEAVSEVSDVGLGDEVAGVILGCFARGITNWSTVLPLAMLAAGLKRAGIEIPHGLASLRKTLANPPAKLSSPTGLRRGPLVNPARRIQSVFAAARLAAVIVVGFLAGQLYDSTMQLIANALRH